MARKKKISFQTRQSKRISTEKPPNYGQLPIIFSLERVQSGEFCFSSLTREEKIQFAEALYKRRASTWMDIARAGKYQLGCEKLPTSIIKTELPPFITEDEHTLLAFRFCGKAPMVGYRVRNVFYILWFDPKFKLYNHG